MADSDFVIELILRARDETARAFAGAAEKMEALRALEERSKREADQTTEAFKRQETQINKVSDAQRARYEKDTRANRQALDQQVALERATREHQKALDDGNRSYAERRQKAQELENAEKNLIQALQRSEEGQRAFSEKRARAHAENVRAIHQEGQALEGLERNLSSAARQRETEHRKEMERQREKARTQKANADAELDLLRVIDRERQKTASDNDRRLAEGDRREQQRRQNLAREARSATQAERLRAAEEKRINDGLEQQHRRLIGLERERNRLREQRARFTPEQQEVIKQRIELDEKAAVAKVDEFVAHASAKQIDIRVDANITRALVEGEALRKELGRTVHMKVDVDTQSAGSNISQFFTALEQRFGDSSQNIAAFDNLIRGAITFLITGFLQPLVVIAGAAAGALAALGSSAIFAGGALGGALVAGIAQAIPLVGVLVLAFSRVAAIFNVIKQGQLVQQQEAGKTGQAHAKQADQAAKLANRTDQVSNAHNSLTNAMNGVRDAHQRVDDAQKNLTKSQDDLNVARQQAIRDLQDLELAERRATAGQVESQKSLAFAIASGGDVAGAQLARDEATLQARRTQESLSGAQAAGVEGAPGVVQAKERIDQSRQQVQEARQGVQQSVQAVAQAQRGLDGARRGVDTASTDAVAAADKLSAGAGKLQFLEQQLSGTEKRVYQSFKRIFDLYNDPKGPIRGISDIILASFGDLADRIYAVMTNPTIITAFLGLARGVATSIRRVTDAFLSNAAIRQWVELIGQATSNLRPLTGIAINLGKIFLGIAQAAAPALRLILNWIDDFTTQWAAFTGSFRGQNVLTSFFTEGVKHLKAWADLAAEVARLFLAIAGPGGGAKLGLDLVRGATAGISRLTGDIENHGKAWQFLQRLWRITSETLDALKPVFIAIGRELDKTFSEQGVQSVRAFGRIFAEIIVPAFGQFIRAVGGAVIVFGRFIAQHPEAARLMRNLVGALLALGFATRVMGILTGGLVALIRVGRGAATAFAWIRNIGVATGESSGALAQLTAAFRILTGPVGIITTLVLGLLTASGKLDDVWRAVKSAGVDLWNSIKRPVLDLVRQVQLLFREVAKGRGAFGIVKAAVSFLTDNVLIVAIRNLGSAIGNVIGGIVRVFSGVIQFIRGFVTLFTDPGKGLGLIVGGVKKIFGGLAQIIIGSFMSVFGAPLRIVFGLVRSVFTGIFNFIKGVFGGIASVVAPVFRVLTIPFRLAFNAIRGIFNFLKPFFVGIFDVLGFLFRNSILVITTPFRIAIRVIVAIFRPLVRFFRGLISDIGGTFSDIAGFIAGAFRRGIRIARTIFGPFIGVIKGLVEGLGDVIGDIAGFFAGAFRRGVRLARAVFGPFIRLIGGWVSDIGDAFSAVADAVSDAWNAIPGIFRGVVNAVIDAINAVTGSINDVTPGKIEILGEVVFEGFPNIPKIPHLGDSSRSSATHHPHASAGAGAATGAYVGGEPSEGDSVPVWVKPGEVIMNQAQQVRAGISNVMQAMRGAPIIGGRWRGFQAGGRPGRGGASAKTSIHTEANITIDTDQAVKQLQVFATIFTRLWRRLWNIVSEASSDGSKRTLTQFTVLRRRGIQAIEGLTDRVKTEFDQMQKKVLSESRTMAKNVNTSFESITDTVFKGMKYIVDTTNKGLKGFDAKLVKVSITPPKDNKKAGGGWIGNKGERGQDNVATVLGRGEAVLNWAHQRAVEPALRAAYGFGLDGLFQKTSAYHAGGPGSATGFAQGGNTGPGHSGEGFTPVWNMAQSKFHMSNFTGFDGHSQMTSSGNVSDHFKHMALDMSNGILTAQEDALSAFFKKKVPQVVKQLIWRDHDQFQGFSVPGHQDHVHLAMKPQYAFDKERTAKILSAAIRGLDFTDLLVGGDGGSGADSIWKNIKRAVVKGDGFMADMVQKALDTARTAANKYGHKKVDDVSKSEFLKGGKAMSDPITKHFRGPASTFGPPGEGSGGTAYGRSSSEPGIAIDPDPPGGWNNKVAQSLALNWFRVSMGGGHEALLQVIDKGPSAGARMIDITGAGSAKMGIPQAQFPTDSIADAKYAGTHALGGFAGYFASGGPVGGPLGRAMHAILHAGEWVLNSKQQSAIAGAMGTSVGKLRDSLGFTGGPTEFQGGTGATTDAPADPKDDKKKKDDAAADADKAAADAADATGSAAKAVESIKSLIEDFGDLMVNALKRVHITGEKAIKRWEEKFKEMDDAAKTRFVGRLGIYQAPALLPSSAPQSLQELVATTTTAQARSGKLPTGAIGELGRATDVNEALLAAMTHALGGLPKFAEKGEPGKKFKKAQELLTKGFDQFLANLDQITGDNGVIALVNAAIEQLATHLAAGAALAAVGIRRVDKTITARGRGTQTTSKLLEGEEADRALTPAQLAAAESQSAAQVGAARRIERELVRRQLLGVDQTLSQMRKAHLQGTDEYQKLMGHRNDFLKQMDDIDQQIADAAATEFDKAKEAILAGWEQQLKPLTVESSRLGAAQHIAEALGRGDLLTEIGNATIENLQSQRDIIQDQMTKAQALAAADPRWQEEADTLATQFNDLGAQIFDKTIEIFNNQLATVDRAVGREQAALDRSGRLADVQEKLGDRTGAAGARVGVSQAREGELQSQIARYEILRERAAQLHNTGAVEDLTDKIEDLQVQVQEQIATTKELIAAQHQLSVDILSGRTTAATGFFGAANTILQGIADLTGSPTDAGQRTAREGLRDFLRNDAGRIIALAQENIPYFGGAAGGLLGSAIEAFQQGPAAFAAWLAANAPALAEAETTMSDADRKIFDDLINSMVGNTTATLENEKALKELDNTFQPQAFASTLWAGFRRAVFTGSGGLLPQYQTAIPSMQTGGIARRTGLYMLHAGEVVTPSDKTGDFYEGDTNVYVTEQMQVADPNVIARRVAFEKSSRLANSR